MSPTTSSQYNYNIPSDVTIDHTIQHSEWTFGGPEGDFQHTATINETLSLLPTDVFLLTRTGNTDSNLKVTTQSSQPGDSATIQTHVKYNQQDTFDQIMFARISKPQKQFGIGAFTPDDQTMNGIEFDFTIILPTSPSSPVNVFTDVPSTTQIVDKISSFRFEALQLESSGGAIQVDSVDTVAGEFKTENSAIMGTFSTTQALQFKTSNRLVRVDAGLHSTGSGTDEIAFDAQTSVADIQATVSLYSSTGSGGVFDVSTKTAFGKVDVQFPAAPVGSALNLNVHNISGPTHVHLHPTFEGNFRLQTTDGHNPTLNKLSVSDPTGQGRTRTINTQTPSQGVLTGVVYWGQDPVSGNVNIETTSADNILDL